MKKSNKVTFLTQAAVIAAIYVVLTIIFAPFSFGEVQVRISEALTVLPFFTPAAIPGLFVGCIIANLFGGAIPADIVFGSIATLLGALGTYALRKNEQILSSAAADHCQHPDRTVRPLLRIRCQSADPVYDADSRHR